MSLILFDVIQCRWAFLFLILCGLLSIDLFHGLNSFIVGWSFPWANQPANSWACKTAGRSWLSKSSWYINNSDKMQYKGSTLLIVDGFQSKRTDLLASLNEAFWPIQWISCSTMICIYWIFFRLNMKVGYLSTMRS